MPVLPSRARNLIVKTVIYYNVITLLKFDSYIRTITMHMLGGQP